MPQPVQGLVHKVGRQNHFVVVQEHHHVVAENGRAGKTHVAYGTVPSQRDSLSAHIGGYLAHSIHDERCLAIGDEGHVDRRVLIDDVPYAMRDALGLLLRTYQQHDDARKMTDLLERSQAAIKFGAGGRQVRRMVVRPRRLELGGSACPVTRNDDCRIHAAPSPETHGRTSAHRAVGEGTRRLFRIYYLVVPT